MTTTTQSFDTVKKVLANLPTSWVELTTHRLDIYDESQAKSQFLDSLQSLAEGDDFTADKLNNLPTAYDYIRLGHQLSSLLEWQLAQINGVSAEQVISFTSKTMPLLAILRDNTIAKKNTHIYFHTHTSISSPLSSPLLDKRLDEARLSDVYGYDYQIHRIDNLADIKEHADESVILVTDSDLTKPLLADATQNRVSACVNVHPEFGSVMVIYGDLDSANQMVKSVQHVRRRETIAMSPKNCLSLLNIINGKEALPIEACSQENVGKVYKAIADNTGSKVKPLVASSGLSIQYAILMGLVEQAQTLYPNKPINLILPPNCYGGTNDQARRISQLISDVSIVDLPVDSGKNLVDSLDAILTDNAKNDSVPIVLAEIPTNPRVEVPDMARLALVLSEKRITPTGSEMVAPIFIIDQTFCPHVRLMGEDSPLADSKLVSFSSGSKFPSGGRCIAGYCAVNDKAESSIEFMGAHLALSDNAATDSQMNTLAENMPSMAERIKVAYENTRFMVEQVVKILPSAKINFVSEQLAQDGFTPSVFSLDLPAKGDTPLAREENKKELNKKLIDFMIERHPDDCKYCVSYGQLKGSYWTIPATSTQGTTKETDKDYIVRVALSPDVNVSMLCQSFSEFCQAEHLV